MNDDDDDDDDDDKGFVMRSFQVRPAHQRKERLMMIFSLGYYKPHQNRETSVQP